jgi:hypothetical protein
MHLLEWRGKQMPTQAKSEKPSSLEDFHTSKTGEGKKLDRTAEEAASKASKTEKRFDKDHTIISK